MLASFREGEILAESRNSVELNIGDIQSKENESVEIPVYLPAFTNKVLLSISFEINTDLLEVISLKKGYLPEWTTDSYRIFQKEGKTIISLIWFSTSKEGVTLKPDQLLFYIQAKAKKPIRGLDGVLQFSKHQEDDNRVYAPYGDIRPLNLKISPLDVGKVANSPFKNNKHQAYPTVVQNQSTFTFELKQAERVELMIVNLNGQIVQRQSYDLLKGQQQITLDGLNNLEPGTFHYHLIANGQKLSGTLLKAE